MQTERKNLSDDLSNSSEIKNEIVKENNETDIKQEGNKASKKKKVCLNTVKIVSFLLIFALLTKAVSWMLIPKNNTKADGVGYPDSLGYKAEPDNSLDVVMIGNSDVYSGFSPLELYKNTGISSYVSGVPSQTMGEAVVTLLDVYKTQNPKVVFFDVDTVYTGTYKMQYAAKHFIANVAPVFLYHDRWKWTSVSKLFAPEDFTNRCYSKGQKVNPAVLPYTGGDYMGKSEDYTDIPEMSEMAFHKFIEICNNHGSQVVLTAMPSVNWRYGMHNAIQEFANNYNVDFIDFNLINDKVGIDWSCDSRDRGGHLNCAGAKKVTAYLENYIPTHFQLTDHRGDDNYSLWDSDYQAYEKLVKLQQSKKK